MTWMLAYRPFVDPFPLLDVHTHWFWLLVPMAFFIALAYKAVRLRSMERYWQGVALMTTQVVLAMVALAAGAFVLVEVYARTVASQ